MKSELTKNSKKIIKKQLRILKKINLKNPLKTATMSFTNTFKKFRENQRIKEVNIIKFEEKEKNQNYQTKGNPSCNLLVLSMHCNLMHYVANDFYTAVTTQAENRFRMELYSIDR